MKRKPLREKGRGNTDSCSDYLNPVMTHAEAQDSSGSPLIITGPGTMTQVSTKWPLLLGEAEGSGQNRTYLQR